MRVPSARVVTLIELHDGRPFSVECEGDVYDFDYCKRDNRIYYHLSGCGPFRGRREAPQFVEPEETIKTVQVWCRSDVVLVDENDQPADPIARGYQVLTEYPGDPFDGPWDVAEDSTVYCRTCDDRLPENDWGGDPCEHLWWCNKCGVWGGAADYGCEHERNTEEDGR